MTVSNEAKEKFNKGVAKETEKLNKKKRATEQELPNMPAGDVPISVRMTAEKLLEEKELLKAAKITVDGLEEKLLTEMAREKVFVCVVVRSHKKYYVRLEHKADKIKI